jgi:putative oxygen-independent coproporphyrinogen III oxidase
LERERHVLADPPDTVFVGGGTPTFTEVEPLRRLLTELTAAEEITVEANPETLTPAVARLLWEHGVTRVSVGAQSFSPHLLQVLERTATPDDVRRAVHHLRDVGFDNISLDLLYGIPGESPSDLSHDLTEALALEPEHLSCYELEAKSGTRFTEAWGPELARQADAMELHLDQVVDTLTGAGYRWYETANFCRTGAGASGRDLRARHNLAIWHGADYVGIGIGAVSTIGSVRRRNAPSLARYVDALEGSADPRRDTESLDPLTRLRERLMLGLRLDEPVQLADVRVVVDGDVLSRLVAGELVELVGDDGLRLTRRGRFLGGAVTAELITWDPEIAHPTTTASTASASTDDQVSTVIADPPRDTAP